MTTEQATRVIGPIPGPVTPLRYPLFRGSPTGKGAHSHLLTDLYF